MASKKKGADSQKSGGNRSQSGTKSGSGQSTKKAQVRDEMTIEEFRKRENERVGNSAFNPNAPVQDYGGSQAGTPPPQHHQKVTGTIESQVPNAEERWQATVTEDDAKKADKAGDGAGEGDATSGGEASKK